MSKPTSPCDEESHPGKLTLQDREIMFEAWQERQSVTYVTRVTGFGTTTVSKYRKLDRWDRRLEQIYEKAQELSDLENARELARLRQHVVHLRCMMIRRYMKHYEDPSYYPTMKDVELVMKLNSYIWEHQAADVQDPLEEIRDALRRFDEEEAQKEDGMQGAGPPCDTEEGS